LITAPDGLFPKQDMAMFRTMLDPQPSAEALAALEEEPREILELLNALKGGATIYLTSPGPASGDGEIAEPVFGVLLEPRGSSAEFQARIKAMVAEQQQITFLQRDGLEVAVPTRSLVDAEAFEAGMIFGQDRFAFVTGENRPAVKAEFERLLGRLAGASGEGVETNAQFQGALRSLKTAGQVQFFLDLRPLVAMGLASAEADDMPLPAAAMLERSGLDGLTFVAARMNVGAVENFDLEVYMPYPEKSLIGMLLSHFGAGTVEHLRRVPSDALSVSVGSFDWYGLFEDGLSLADEFEEGTAEMARAQLDAFSSFVGFDIEQDLLAQLAGPLVSFTRQAPTTGQTATNATEMLQMFSALGATYLISVRDADTVEGALLDLVDFASAQSGGEFALKETDLDGSRIWGLDVQSPEGPEIPFALGFTPSEQANGVMAMGLNPSDVANALKDPAGRSSSVLDHEKLGPLLRANVGRGPLQVADTAATLKSVAGMLGGLAETMGSFTGEGDEEAMRWLNAMDPSAIERYLKGTGLQVLELQGGGVRVAYQSR
jgi:hypothetical protein